MLIRSRIRRTPLQLPLMSATRGCSESSETGYTVAEAAELEPGDNVCVREGVLQSRPDLAGRLGMVVAPYNPSTGRIAVQVEDEAAPMAHSSRTPSRARVFRTASAA